MIKSIYTSRSNRIQKRSGLLAFTRAQPSPSPPQTKGGNALLKRTEQGFLTEL